MQKHIPNYNSFATALERFTIESVKLGQFQIKQLEATFTAKSSFNEQIETQEQIIHDLSIITQNKLAEIVKSGGYSYYGETRTINV